MGAGALRHDQNVFVKRIAHIPHAREHHEEFGRAYTLLVDPSSELPQVGGAFMRCYRDDSGLEVDAIIEKADRSWAGIEIKLSPEKVDEGAASLIRMRDKLAKDELARTAPPSFLAVRPGKRRGFPRSSSR